MSFNFGAPNTTTATGFTFTSTATFGVPQTNAPAFGTPQTNTPAFGAPQANVPAFGTPQVNVPAFGTPLQSNTPAFSTTTQANAPAFGATQTNTPAFGFGVTPSTQPQQSGFGATSFGVPAAATTTAAGPSFGFTTSVPTTLQQPPAFSSFASTTTQPTLPIFGATTTPASTASTLGGLAKPAGVTFGTTTTAPGTLPSFGLGTSTVAPNPMTTTSASSGTGFSFNAPTGQLNFGAQPTATTASTIGGGLFGLKSTPALSFNPTTSIGSFGTSAVTASTTTQSAPKVGLGGFDVSASQPKTVEGRSESVRAKDSQLPQEILNTVEMLKPHIKQQKTMSSNIARTSTRKLFNVSKELQNCDLKLSEISNYVANNYAAIKSLRSETAGAIRQAEMAQRTHETPPGLQFENTAPLKYFLELVQKFESDMLTFRNQVTLTEKHIRSLTNPQGFTTAEDLKKGLQQMHESFIALAGRVHETHQKVEALKEQYLNLRKHKLKDNSNVFEEKQTAANNKTSSMGPTPFSTLAGTNLSMSYIPNQAAWTQTQPNQENLFGVGQSNFGNSIQSTTLGTGNAFGSINSTDGGFSLQKPPVGLKRLKSTPALSFNPTTSIGSFGTSAVTASTTTQSAPKVGLGGFDVSASQPKTVEGRSESVRAKDSQLPQEILNTVEMLKPHIKQQKTMSSNIARTSTRKLFNVSKELQNCDLKLSEISNYVANNYAAIKSLRSETAGAIRQAEMAQRTHETPPGLQFENTAPLKYFLELVQKFESDMLTFRNQVTLTEKHIRSLTNPQGFTTAEDLKKGLQQMHESFIALAGRVHETHQKVEALKEQYLNLRKHKLKDNSNVFEEKQTAANNKTSSMGPTPFSTLAGTNLSMSYIPNQAAWTQTQPNQENLFGVGQSNFGNSIQSTTLGTGNAFGSINSTDGGFSLQKPPVGLKRNKH